MKKTVLNASLWTALLIASGLSLSACGGGVDSHDVFAVERVNAAADQARANAPEAEDFEFPETAPMVIAETDATETTAMDDAMAAPADAAAPAEDLAVNVGAELYNKQCMACHATGLLNAPKYGDAAAWGPRIEKGVDTLTSHSANGFNQMPAQAYNGVTEDQIRQAVEYMIDAAS
ncbi:c-type cytochrome [Psychrobacter sp. DM8]|uniref:c-type cytochrome n=1 Tax=unclassified Psychrobacter TaxID=196806 RepID=UPI003F4FA512